MYLYEHILASHYHWSLDDIRNLDLQDFYIHLRICLIREDTDREFQAKLAGATFGDEGHATESKEHVTGRKKLKSGAVTETKTRTTRLRQTIGSMAISKTGEVISFDQPELADPGE